MSLILPKLIVRCNSICGDKDVVTEGKVERNEKGEVFCPPCRTGKKVL